MLEMQWNVCLGTDLWHLSCINSFVCWEMIRLFVFSHTAAAWVNYHSTMQRLVGYQTSGDSISTQDSRDSQMAEYWATNTAV